MWDAANGWAHANIRNGSTYVNGIEVDGTTTQQPTDYSIISLVTSGNVEASTLALDRTYRTGGIKLAELLIYDRALTDDERLSVEAYLYQKWMVPGAAFDGVPAGGSTDVPRDTALSWTAGQFAATHDVYFGTDFDDVNDASRDNPLDVLVSQGQTGTTYALPTVLEYGQTYYWRVDEVNAAPDNTIFKGETWSFTVEPVAYPIENVVATSNGVSEPGIGPENTVNASGLNAADEHSIESGDMWLASPAADGATYIEYEFDAVLKLHQMLVWNYNVQFELMLGFGLKDVTVEYSENGTDWTVLGDVQFNQATATAAYTANTTVDFGGVAAKYVRLTVNSGYGMLGQYGLSEVRFLYVPVTARDPEPVDAATDVSVDTILDWRAGREAVSHEVYLSDDEAAVADGTALAGVVAESSYVPADVLLADTYYWMVVEVNEAEAISAWEGSIWSFTTEEFIVVDDFESYTDDEGSRVYEIWEDGWINGTGSTVGYMEAPFAEQEIVHGGSQAMPLYYDGDSEADLTLAGGQDWTRAGVTTLTLYFRGEMDNEPGQLYALINGKRVDFARGPDAVTQLRWQQWNIDLASVGTNLANVSMLTIGIEGSGSGLIFVDDVRLYREAPSVAEPVDPGTDGVLLEYTFEGNTNDSSGNGYNGTLLGDASVQNGVLVLDGTRDAMSVPRIGGADATFNQFTVSMWVYPTEDMTSLDFSGGMNTDVWEAGAMHFKFHYGAINVGINGLDGGDLEGATIAMMDTWSHIAVTVSETEIALYLNGGREDSRVLDAPLDVVLGAASLGGWNNGGTLSREMAGEMDDVLIYDRALSEGEVLFLAENR